MAAVTGAGSGIGRAVALRFGAEGAAVVVADVLGDAAESVAKEIETGGGRAVGMAVDVSDPAQAQAMVDRAVPDPDSLVVGPPQKAASGAFFSPRRDTWWLLGFIIVSVRLWYAFDPHPFMSGVNSTASFLSGTIWVFGVVVSVASLYFLYWTYWLKRRRQR